MKHLARTMIAVVLAAQAASLLAADITGVWKGKVTVDTAKAPKPKNPQEQQAMDSGLAMMKKMQLVLTLKANKTFTAEAKNVPGQQGVQKNEGTWKQDGNTLWLTGVKENGKPAKDKKPQKFLIVAGGKQLTVATEGMPAWVKVIFTR